MGLFLLYYAVALVAQPHLSFIDGTIAAGAPITHDLNASPSALSAELRAMTFDFLSCWSRHARRSVGVRPNPIRFTPPAWKQPYRPAYAGYFTNNQFRVRKISQHTIALRRRVTLAEPGLSPRKNRRGREQAWRRHLAQTPQQLCRSASHISGTTDEIGVRRAGQCCDVRALREANRHLFATVDSVAVARERGQPAGPLLMLMRFQFPVCSGGTTCSSFQKCSDEDVAEWLKVAVC